MENKELKDYVDKARTAKTSDDEIREELIKKGWSAKDVSDALAQQKGIQKKDYFKRSIKIILKSILVVILAFLILLTLALYIGTLGYSGTETINKTLFDEITYILIFLILAIPFWQQKKITSIIILFVILLFLYISIPILLPKIVYYNRNINLIKERELCATNPTNEDCVDKEIWACHYGGYTPEFHCHKAAPKIYCSKTGTMISYEECNGFPSFGVESWDEKCFKENIYNIMAEDSTNGCELNHTTN